MADRWLGSWWQRSDDKVTHCTDYGRRRPPWAGSDDRLSYLCGASHHAGNDAVFAVTVAGIPMGVAEAPASACTICVRLDKALWAGAIDGETFPSACFWCATELTPLTVDEDGTHLPRPCRDALRGLLNELVAELLATETARAEGSLTALQRDRLEAALARARKAAGR